MKFPVESIQLFGLLMAVYFRSWLWIKDFCETNFGAYILSEPTYPIEVVKDIGGDSEVLSERNLKLEVAPQIVVFNQSQRGLGNYQR